MVLQCDAGINIAQCLQQSFLYRFACKNVVMCRLTAYLRLYMMLFCHSPLKRCFPVQTDCKDVVQNNATMLPIYEQDICSGAAERRADLSVKHKLCRAISVFLWARLCSSGADEGNRADL